MKVIIADILSSTEVVANASAGQTKVEQVNALIDCDPAEEPRLVRKLDMRVLLPCCIVYFLAYLDRANMVRNMFAQILSW